MVFAHFGIRFSLYGEFGDDTQSNYRQESRYCNYSQGDFEVFAPQGRHIPPIIVIIWDGRVN